MVNWQVLTEGSNANFNMDLVGVIVMQTWKKTELYNSQLDWAEKYMTE